MVKVVCGHENELWLEEKKLYTEAELKAAIRSKSIRQTCKNRKRLYRNGTMTRAELCPDVRNLNKWLTYMQLQYRTPAECKRLLQRRTLRNKKSLVYEKQYDTCSESHCATEKTNLGNAYTKAAIYTQKHCVPFLDSGRDREYYRCVNKSTKTRKHKEMVRQLNRVEKCTQKQCGLIKQKRNNI